jgi:hypothetical protein
MIPAPSDFSQSIAFRKRDGQHGLVGWHDDARGYPVAAAWLWTRANTLREHALPGWSGYLGSSSCSFCGQDRLIVCGLYKAGGAPPMRVAEYSTATDPFTLIQAFDFGDDFTTNPISCELASGAFVLVAYQQTGSRIWLKTAYRKPALPGLSVVSNAWIFQEFNFTLDGSEIASMNYTLVQQADGSLWLVMSRDGSARLCLARFAENNGLVSLDFQGDYFCAFKFDGQPRDGDMSPGDEFPSVSSVADPAHGRVLLLYPRTGATWRCGSSFEPGVVVACYPDKRRELIAVLPHEQDAKLPSPGALWPLPKQINYLVPSNDAATCETAWRFGSIQSGAVLPENPTNLKVDRISPSSDGFIAYADATGLVITIPQQLVKKRR